MPAAGLLPNPQTKPYVSSQRPNCITYVCLLQQTQPTLQQCAQNVMLCWPMFASCTLGCCPAVPAPSCHMSSARKLSDPRLAYTTQ